MSTKISWQLSRANAGGLRSPTIQGTDSENFNLVNISLATWNQLFAGDLCVFVVQPSGVTATLASGGTLTVSTTYYYKITAFGGVPTANAQETEGSNEVSVTPTSGNQSAKITWPAQQAAQGYKIYRGTAAGSENLLVGTVNSGSTLTFTDTGFAGTAASPPGSMPSNFVEFALNSFVNLVNETVTPGHALSIFVQPSGINAQCLLTPGSSNPLTWFFSGTTPGINIPITAASGNGGVFSLSAPSDNAGQAITGGANTLRITNGGTGNLAAAIEVLVGP